MKRRSFITSSVAAGVASTMVGDLLGPLGAKAYAYGPQLARLAWAGGTGRVLVIVQLDGGNDGLNTVIPGKDPLYAQLRGALAITDGLKISDTLDIHPGMATVHGMFNEGQVAVVQNVGYPNPNRSHFRSTDIWFTAANNSVPADQSTYLYDGWMGRYLDHRYPGYPDTTPAHPMALQIGTTTGLMLQGPAYPMGMAINDPETFYRIISGTDTSGAEKPDLSTPAGLELDFIQRISSEAMSYAKPVREAFNSTANLVTYPTGSVANQLKIIARLIAGGLETPVYVISQRGYDTHTGQRPAHQRLMKDLSDGISFFFNDLKAMGVADRVALMTLSEFGRRAQANGLGTGQEGTDHGTAAPMLFVGPKVHGGIYGHDPDLANLKNGDIVNQYDFKQTYSSVLQQYFGVNPSDAALVLKGQFATLPLFDQAPVGVAQTGAAGFALEQNYPNPVSLANGASTSIRFTLAGGNATLKVYDVQGRLVSTLADGSFPPGAHEAVFNARALDSGTYFYRLESRGHAETRTLFVTK
ncbi:MAG: DUF1501 domain-containing protein [Ignavibacteria bacterium]|nr:DUF1501 domain-containing protein [Ignavibacteria bacterium]